MGPTLSWTNIESEKHIVGKTLILTNIEQDKNQIPLGKKRVGQTQSETYTKAKWENTKSFKY